MGIFLKFQTVPAFWPNFWVIISFTYNLGHNTYQFPSKLFWKMRWLYTWKNQILDFFSLPNLWVIMYAFHLVLQGISALYFQPNEDVLKKFNCNNPSECANLTGIFKCRLGHCANLSEIYYCRHRTEKRIEINSDTDNLKLNGLFDCNKAKYVIIVAFIWLALRIFFFF